MLVHFLFLAAAGFVPVTAHRSPSPAIMSDPDTVVMVTRARAVVSAMAADRFDAAEQHFDSTVRTALPPERLAAAWKQITSQAGNFTRIDGDHLVVQPPYTTVVLDAVFERATLDVMVSFDSTAQVRGLRFTPHAPATGAAEPPPYADMSRFHEEPVTVRDGNWELPGTLSRPTGAGPVPAVVLVHGSGPNDRDETIGANKPFRDLAWGLASRGIAVLRYDKRTLVYGAEMAKAGSITVQNETIDDVLAAVRLLQHTPGIDPARIVVLGHSLGGTLVPRIATQDSAIAGFVIMAGATRQIQDLMVEQVAYIDSIHGDTSDAARAQLEQLRAQVARINALTPAVVAGAPDEKILGAPVSYWLDLRGYHPEEVAKQVHRPMLILQGGRDYQVTRVDYAAWQHALGKRSDVTFHLYPLLNHLFIAGTEPSRPEEYGQPGHVDVHVVDDIATWVSALPLRGTPPPNNQ